MAKPEVMLMVAVMGANFEDGDSRAWGYVFSEDRSAGAILSIRISDDDKAADLVDTLAVGMRPVVREFSVRQVWRSEVMDQATLEAAKTELGPAVLLQMKKKDKAAATAA